MSTPSPLTRLKGDNNEGALVAVLVVLIVVMTLLNPEFLSFSTFFSIVRSSLVPTVLRARRADRDHLRRNRRVVHGDRDLRGLHHRR